MTARDAGGDDSLGNAGRDGAFDDGGDRVHGTDNFGLELWGNMEFDLLEEVFRSTEAAHDENILYKKNRVSLKIAASGVRHVPVGFCSELGWR